MAASAKEHESAIVPRPHYAARDASVISVSKLEMAYAAQRPWPFAETRQGEIAALFATLKLKNPALWNGRVLMLGDYAVSGANFRGTFFSVDFASFLAWRHWGYPDRGVRDCFAMGALRGADGAFLLGVMGASTANAGLIYFPCGTPDHSDIVGDKVDLEANIARELTEETGLNITAFAAAPDWVTVLVGPWIANMKLLQAREPAAVLRGRILDFLARQNRPELADIRIVRGPDDIDPMMPPHVVAYLQYMWQSNVRT
jgi:hypothetical protein